MKKKPQKTPRITAIAVIIMSIAIITTTATACDVSDNYAPSISQPHVPQVDTEPEVPLVTVPDLGGYMREELEHQFDELGLTPTFARIMSDAPVGAVVYISKAGQRVEQGATIEVHVSVGLPEAMPDTDVPLADPAVVPPDLSTLSGPPQTGDNVGFGGINWRVLDVEENKALLLSEFILFYRPFNDVLGPIHWDESTLRQYLNNEFLENFSPEEKARIAVTRNTFTETRVESGEFVWYVPGGEDTDDLVFLLSRSDVGRYFGSVFARRTTNTGWLNRCEDSDMWWWLLDDGGAQFSNYTIMQNGQFGGAHVDFWWIGVRPALWVELG